MEALASIPGVLDVTVFRGARAPASAPPDLVLEIPHGATRTSDFDALAAELEGPLPPGLVDFFHVNTDAGTPELGALVAERFVAAEATRSAAVLRCRIPRTFIDCNRHIDARPEEFKAGGVTPGLMPWITTPADRALLRDRYDTYIAAVRAIFDQAMPQGALLLLHTYAPRTVDVEVDLAIVEKLHREYQAERIGTWPMRPEIDVIARDMEGHDHAPRPVLEQLRGGMSELGIAVSESHTYPMHPSTIAYGHVLRWPGRVICIEVRRDLLAEPFAPFVQMHIGRSKTEAIGGPIASAMRRFFP